MDQTPFKSHFNVPLKARFKAVIFDLDGVVTKTSEVHEKAWKTLFDEFLSKFSENNREFTSDDYNRYVNGRPRLEGIKTFLNSRNISIPEGKPDDDKEAKTIWGLGNKKTEYFLKLLHEQGVGVYESTVSLIRELRGLKIKIGVVSSSKNCVEVLQRANLEKYFDVRVDGITAESLRLKGKPEPDTFLTCAKVLGVEPEQAVVVEDASSGVKAGASGNFGLVVGLDRANNRKELLEAGASIVIGDFDELTMWYLNAMFPYHGSQWSIDFDCRIQKKLEETLCTLGNGFFSIRGAPEETPPARDESAPSYPAMYLAGGYNRAFSEVAGKKIDNEDFVNFPIWTAVTFKGEDDEEWFSSHSTLFETSQCHKKLHVKDGILFRRITVTNKKTGARFTIISQRFVHMKEPHLGCLKYFIISDNWSGNLLIRSAIDASVENHGVDRYRGLTSKHLKVLEKGTFKMDEEPQEEGIFVVVETLQSKMQVGVGAMTRVFCKDQPLNCRFKTIMNEEVVEQIFKVEVKPGSILCLEKFGSVCSNRNRGIMNAGEACVEILIRNGCKRFLNLLHSHQLSMKAVWHRGDFKVRLNDYKEKSFLGHIRHSDYLQLARDPSTLSTKHLQFLIRFHFFHLFETYSLNSIPLDVSIPARGLHGESYRGHIFWDEVFVLPLVTLRVPELTRSALLYRYYRLNTARQNAKKLGYFGACYPWQSGSTGKEETQQLHYNPLSKKWDVDLSSLQLHINIAIFYDIYYYFRVTKDVSFMEVYGLEMMLEMTRFWSNRAIKNHKTGRYEILGVMGPDEFHEKYPGRETGGLDNNAYTNIMVAWTISRTLEVLEVVSERRRHELLGLLHIDHEELQLWNDMSRKMTVVFQKDGIISQFQGWEDLKELDWEFYRKKYANIQRMDRILRAEGSGPEEYKVCKQADLVMVFYLLSQNDVLQLMHQLGYPFDRELILRNVNYYLARTSHGSTLSLVVYSQVFFDFDIQKGWDLYKMYILSDVSDIQMGTTQEGIHVVPLASSMAILLFKVCGIDTSEKAIRFDPKFPEEVKSIRLRFQFKHAWLVVKVSKTQLEVTAEKGAGKAVKMIFHDQIFKIPRGSSILFNLCKT